MPLTPFVRTPFTGIVGPDVVTSQWGGRCGNLEMKAVECLEAYGLVRGGKACENLLDDFQECVLHTKENLRNYAMRAERHRQYKTGERDKKHLYAEPPKDDSY